MPVFCPTPLDGNQHTWARIWTGLKTKIKELDTVLNLFVLLNLMYYIVCCFTGNPVTEWCEICKLGRAFPSLQMLVVADCPLTSLDPSSPCSSPDRSIYSRSESECEGSPRRNSPHDSFRELCVLNLNGTLLGSWEDIERLGRFPNLHCLRIQGCPLFDVSCIFSWFSYLIACYPTWFMWVEQIKCR